ncbi:GNAT family N-acetyltransferase [Shivajiella indica]|uniref:GNAT family N-acetyltransferase n=1 Tax=Shivajiella indica TaxID=872115 RepID=A0ABW5BAT5_9BACT
MDIGFPIQTERMIIRELTLRDADFIFQLLNTPGWLKYIGDRGINSIEDAKNYLLEGPLKSYSKNGFGLYLVLMRNGLQKLGIAGLLKREYLPFPDIGFAFLPEFEGKGFAFECSKAILGYSKVKLGLDKIQAIVLPKNNRSIRLLEKLGMEDQGLFLFPGQNDQLRLFQIDLEKNAPQT